MDFNHYFNNLYLVILYLSKINKKQNPGRDFEKQSDFFSDIILFHQRNGDRRSLSW